MSSNSADTGLAAGIPDRRPPWSMARWLTFATAISSFLILALVSLQMYFMLVAGLNEENRHFLLDEAEALAEMARNPGFHEDLVREIGIEHAGEEYLLHYIRMVEKEGTQSTIIETPHMEEILPRNLFPHPSADGMVHHPVSVKRRDSHYLVTSLLVPSAPQKGRQTVLQVALDVTNVEKIAGRYRARLAVILVIGMLLCAVCGLNIAWRGTRPIREIAEMARGITVKNLGQRLAGSHWPREVTDLADGLNGMLDRIQDSYSRLYLSVENLTHKLRTPVAILRGETEVALSRERSADELREVLESNMEEYVRLSRLIDNIVFISQVETGKIDLAPALVPARAVIDQVVEYYAPLAEEKEIRLTCEGDATLTADPSLLRRALACLVANAVTFTPVNGSITISARQKEGVSPEIRVTDTGCGISEQDQPKIFDRFYRVYATRFLDPYGTGLGLSLVKTIMDLHKGEIEVRSRAGQGTTVILKFPPV